MNSPTTDPDRAAERTAHPGKLYHRVPGWVEDGAIFHIRIRSEGDPTSSLTEPRILEAARVYHERQRWFCHLIVLMPDHVHALLSFPRQDGMSRIIGEWKHYLAHHGGIRWQDGYFDHRIRNDAEFVEKAAYIRRNPVAKGLCAREEDWPWTWMSAR